MATIGEAATEGGSTPGHSAEGASDGSARGKDERAALAKLSGQEPVGAPC